MGAETGDLVKLAVGVLVSLAAVRIVWKRFCNGSGSRSPEPTNGLKKQPQASSPAGSPKKAHPDDEPGLYIYFGSQSGTAEQFSNELEDEAAQHELSATVIDLENFDPDQFVEHKVVILVLATYGEGDPTDNAVEFFNWLKGDEHDPKELKGMKYCVMGLGNRQYVHFNSCGRQANDRLEELGAERIYEFGEGDDDQNIEEDFERWKENGLWPALRKALGKSVEEDGEKNAKLSKQDVLRSLSLRAEMRQEARKLPVDPLVQTGGACILGKWYFQAHQAKVTSEYELRQVADPAAGKTTKHLEVDVKSIPSLSWRTADNLEVLPRNPDNVVEWWAERLDAKGAMENMLGFVRAQGVDRAVKKPFPTPCSVQDALSLYCDLCAAPSKMQLKKFAPFLKSEEERQALESLLEDRNAYHWLTGEHVRITFRELFELYCSSAEIELGIFLQLCPRQKSRPYTIASSSREDRKTIAICVSVVGEELRPFADVVSELESRGHPAPGAAAALARRGEDGARQPRSFRGLCSSLLCTRVAVGERLWIQARPSTFRLPRRTVLPIVMVGAGTGIAPFRAFLREFRSETTKRQTTILFFGCQKRDVDFLYRDELEEALNSEPKALGELVTAFSREQESKVYVQHRLRDRADDLAELFKQGAYIFVCGAQSMGAAIREEVATILGSTDQVSRLVTEGRYVEELW